MAIKQKPGPKPGQDKPKQIGGTIVPVASYLDGNGAVQVIPPNVAVAVQLAAQGRTFSYIAQRLFVNKGTITRWLKDYANYAEAQMRTAWAAEGLVNHLVPKAVRTYEELLDDQEADDNVRRQVASDVFDRAVGKPVQRILADERQHIKITYEIIDAAAAASAEENDENEGPSAPSHHKPPQRPPT